MRENMDQKISDYGLFLRSAIECVATAVTKMPLNVLLMCYSIALRKKSPYSQIFWSECWKIWTRKTPNTDNFQQRFKIILLWNSTNSDCFQKEFCTAQYHPFKIYGKREPNYGCNTRSGSCDPLLAINKV